MTTSQKKEFILMLKNLAIQQISIINTYRSLKYEYDALDIGSAVKDADLTDFELSKKDMTDVINSFSAIESLIETGHKTNLHKMR